MIFCELLQKMRCCDVEILKSENEILKNELADAREKIALLQEQVCQLQVKKHNERCAGRHSLCAEDVAAIVSLREEGFSIRKIAKKLEISPSTVHKYLH